MTQEVLKLALEALQFALHVGFPESSESQIKKGEKAYQQHRAAITAIKEALREHALKEVQRLGQEIEQEPVAYQDTADKCRLETVPAKGGLLPQRTDEEEYLSKAYRLANELRCHLAIAPAPQRTWVGLTDEEYDEIWRLDLNNKDIMDRTIAKLKQLNT